MRRERGSAPLELALGVLVLMVPVAVMGLSFGPWMQRRSFIRLAAAEAARYVIISDGDVAGAVNQVAVMAANYGVDPETVRIGLCGADPVSVGAGGGSDCGPLPAGGYVTVTVEADVPVVTLPWRDNEGTPVAVGGVVSRYDHSEYVDLYRSTG